MSSTQKAIAKLRASSGMDKQGSGSSSGSPGKSMANPDKRNPKTRSPKGTPNPFFLPQKQHCETAALLMDDDDDSVKAGNTKVSRKSSVSPSDRFTPNLSVHNMTRGNDLKEHVIKFVFRLQSSKDHTHVANTHYAILKAIMDIFPATQVFDNFGRSMKEVPTIGSSKLAILQNLCYL